MHNIGILAEIARAAGISDFCALFCLGACQLIPGACRRHRTRMRSHWSEKCERNRRRRDYGLPDPRLLWLLRYISGGKRAEPSRRGSTTTQGARVWFLVQCRHNCMLYTYKLCTIHAANVNNESSVHLYCDNCSYRAEKLMLSNSDFLYSEQCYMYAQFWRQLNKEAACYYSISLPQNDLLFWSWDRPYCGMEGNGPIPQYIPMDNWYIFPWTLWKPKLSTTDNVFV